MVEPAQPSNPSTHFFTTSPLFKSLQPTSEWTVLASISAIKEGHKTILALATGTKALGEE